MFSDFCGLYKSKSFLSFSSCSLYKSMVAINTASRNIRVKDFSPLTKNTINNHKMKKTLLIETKILRKPEYFFLISEKTEKNQFVFIFFHSTKKPLSAIAYERSLNGDFYLLYGGT